VPDMGQGDDQSSIGGDHLPQAPQKQSGVNEMLQDFPAQHAVKVTMRELLPETFALHIADKDTVVVLGSNLCQLWKDFHPPNFALKAPLPKKPSRPAHVAADV